MGSDFARMVVEAMRAGLAGRRLPDFGPRLKPEQIEVINAVYDEARNRNAGDRVRAKVR